MTSMALRGDEGQRHLSPRGAIPARNGEGIGGERARVRSPRGRPRCSITRERMTATCRRTNMVTTRFSLVFSMMLTLTAVATPIAAQTVRLSSSRREMRRRSADYCRTSSRRHRNISAYKTHASASFSASPRHTGTLGTGPCRSEAAARNLRASSMMWQQSVRLRCRKSLIRTDRLLPFTLPASRCFTPSITTGIRLMSPNSR
jgi:hypothetical protein